MLERYVKKEKKEIQVFVSDMQTNLCPLQPESAPVNHIVNLDQYVWFTQRKPELLWYVNVVSYCKHNAHCVKLQWNFASINVFKTLKIQIVMSQWCLLDKKR